MLTDLQRDILIKAAEGIQEGMWCRHVAFETATDNWTIDLLLQGKRSLEDGLTAKRCAIGEIALRTVQLGGSRRDVDWISEAVRVHLPDSTSAHSIAGHNDECMKDLDQFSAGQEWSRIFREAADV